MDKTVKILVAGDFCVHCRMQGLTGEKIAQSMRSVMPYIAEADYSILNLESAISEKNHKPIQKCGIHLMNNSEMLRAIKILGFNAVTLANNHFADYGSKAVVESLEMLSKYELEYVGAGINRREAAKVLYKTIGDISIGIINCCEHEFTIAGEELGGCNPLDIVEITRSIIEAKRNCDKVIVIVHGGTEHYNLPTPRMQQTYRFFVEQGADAVINHHQHCYSGYEYYQGAPIVYGLGNFCFDMDGARNNPWNEGYMVELEIDEQIHLKTTPYIQCDEQPGVQLLANREYFDERLKELNLIIENPEAVKKAYAKLVDEKRDEYLYLYHLRQNPIIRKLSKKGLLSRKLQDELLPCFLTKERATNLLSFFQCEAHRDLMTLILKDYIKE